MFMNQSHRIIFNQNPITVLPNQSAGVLFSFNADGTAAAADDAAFHHPSDAAAVFGPLYHTVNSEINDLRILKTAK